MRRCTRFAQKQNMSSPPLDFCAELVSNGVMDGAPPTGPAGPAIPPQLLAALQARGGAPSPMPGAPPAALPGSPMANPAAALAQRGQGGMPEPGMAMLLFMAGMGFPVFASHMNKMKPGGEKSHKAGGGLPADAAAAPTQAVPPQLAALLAQRGGSPVPPPGMGGMMPPGMPGMPPRPV